MSKTYKIGIVCPYDYLRFGGVQEHIRFVAENLKQRGHEVRVIAPSTLEKNEIAPAEVLFIGGAAQVKAAATTSEVTISASPKEIDKLYQQEQFDILHFHEPWVPMLSRQLLVRSTATNIATFHAKIPDDWVNRSTFRAWLPYGKNLMRHVDAITAVSTAASEYVGSATQASIKIIPNGIDLGTYNPARYSNYELYDDELKTILYIGRLEKRKGVEYLLKAYRQLTQERSDVRLVIAGDGPRLRTLKSYVSRYKLPNVEFLGFVDEVDKLRLLKTCDVFCSPALYGESFGIVLLEAMAMGAPVVAGNNAGYTAVMQDVGRLSLVDPESISDFANRLATVLDVEPVRQLMLNWAQDYVKQFDYKNVADAYEQLYRQVKGA